MFDVVLKDDNFLVRYLQDSVFFTKPSHCSDIAFGFQTHVTKDFGESFRIMFKLLKVSWSTFTGTEDKIYLRISSQFLHVFAGNHVFIYGQQINDSSFNFLIQSNYDYRQRVINCFRINFSNRRFEVNESNNDVNIFSKTRVKTLLFTQALHTHKQLGLDPSHSTSVTLKLTHPQWTRCKSGSNFLISHHPWQPYCFPCTA